MSKIKKGAQIPKPIKIKKEKTEEDRAPQPMVFYIDDRLEMTKQIFGTLKPKTITNLAPDFLKTKNLEDIEEACLHELLCISTKRLKSIINGTKCPTDTESSDDDSDVQRQDAHISLEEISSDSELEENSTKKAKKKKTLNGSAFNTVKTQKASENDADGQISVLELLELQARARAIRSQLALEPVTKIEVESEDEKTRNNVEDYKKDKGLNKFSRKYNTNESKHLPSEKKTKELKRNDAIRTVDAIASSDVSKHQSTVKKVKLKRNYRRSSAQIEVNAKEENMEASIKIDKDEKYKDSIQIKQEKEMERSPSPDVIPIVAEPETCIIDSSDNEENKKGTISKLQKETVTPKEHKIITTTIEEKTSEPEEGEIEEESGNENISTEVINNNIITQCDIEKDSEDQISQQSNDKRNDTEEQKVIENEQNVIVDDSKRNAKESTSIGYIASVSEDNLNPAKSPSSNITVLQSLTTTQTQNEDDDDDQNDDVISLEGGDLESEMSEHLQTETSNTNSSTFMDSKLDEEKILGENKLHQVNNQLDDVISLDSSDDGRSKDAESWRSRYMRSSKVNKVLLASRLGKRVRDKITKSKRSKKEDSRYKSDVEKEKSTPIFTSRHEDGSVEQYKELLELKQRTKS